MPASASAASLACRHHSHADCCSTAPCLPPPMPPALPNAPCPPAAALALVSDKVTPNGPPGTPLSHHYASTYDRYLGGCGGRMPQSWPAGPPDAPTPVFGLAANACLQAPVPRRSHPRERAAAPAGDRRRLWHGKRGRQLHPREIVLLDAAAPALAAPGGLSLGMPRETHRQACDS